MLDKEKILVPFPKPNSLLLRHLHQFPLVVFAQEPGCLFLHFSSFSFVPAQAAPTSPLCQQRRPSQASGSCWCQWDSSARCYSQQALQQQRLAVQHKSVSSIKKNKHEVHGRRTALEGDLRLQQEVGGMVTAMHGTSTTTSELPLAACTASLISRDSFEVAGKPPANTQNK